MLFGTQGLRFILKYLVLIEFLGTGGVALFALKIARAAGLKVIITSSSDIKLAKLAEQFSSPPLSTINYRTNPNWHETALEITNGVGVDYVIKVGGSATLMQSLKCTRRGGVVSQVGYLSKGKNDTKNWDVEEFLGVLIDRRVELRGINSGSKMDFGDLCAAVEKMEMRFEEIIDSQWEFEKMDEAIEKVWRGEMVGKMVVTL